MESQREEDGSAQSDDEEQSVEVEMPEGLEEAFKWVRMSHSTIDNLSGQELFKVVRERFRPSQDVCDESSRALEAVQDLQKEKQQTEKDILKSQEKQESLKRQAEELQAQLKENEERTNALASLLDEKVEKLDELNKQIESKTKANYRKFKDLNSWFSRFQSLCDSFPNQFLLDADSKILNCGESSNTLPEGEDNDEDSVQREVSNSRETTPLKSTPRKRKQVTPASIPSSYSVTQNHQMTSDKRTPDQNNKNASSPRQIKLIPAMGSPLKRPRIDDTLRKLNNALGHSQRSHGDDNNDRNRREELEDDNQSHSSARSLNNAESSRKAASSVYQLTPVSSNSKGAVRTYGTARNLMNERDLEENYKKVVNGIQNLIKRDYKEGNTDADQSFSASAIAREMNVGNTRINKLLNSMLENEVVANGASLTLEKREKNGREYSYYGLHFTNQK